VSLKDGALAALAGAVCDQVKSRFTWYIGDVEGHPDKERLKALTGDLAALERGLGDLKAAYQDAATVIAKTFEGL
jgi:hypothetical protein